ncbi:MAG TPA: hypothetical protein VHD33_00390, partial [Legionellaceae bacterium]|nr:hypothetical protein [Legionellaceae bacterium]
MSDEPSENAKAPLLKSVEEHEATPELSGLQIITYLLRRGVSMALSYTLPASMVVTALMIARLKTEDKESSEDYLATAALVTTVTHIVVCVSFSPFLAIISIGSEKYGELQRFIETNNTAQIIKTRQKIGDLFKISMLLSTLIVPFPFIVFHFSGTILSDWFGQNQHISDLAQQELRAYSFALPGVMYRICMEQILFSFGKSEHTMLMSLSTFAVGTGLSYFFAFGSPNLGLEGIAYGYVIESYLTCFSFGAY